MKYWLMKTEPDECSIDDALAAPKNTHGAGLCQSEKDRTRTGRVGYFQGP